MCNIKAPSANSLNGAWKTFFFYFLMFNLVNGGWMYENLIPFFIVSTRKIWLKMKKKRKLILIHSAEVDQCKRENKIYMYEWRT